MRDFFAPSVFFSSFSFLASWIAATSSASPHAITALMLAGLNVYSVVSFVVHSVLV